MAPGQQPPHPGSRALSPQQQHPAPYGQPAPAPYSQPPGGNPAYYRPAPAHPTAPAQPAAPGSPNFSSPMDQLSGQMGAMGLNAPASQPRGGRAKRVYAQETGAGAAPPPVAGGPGYPPTSPGHGAPHPGQQPGTAPYQPYGPSAPAGGAAPYGQQTHHPQHHQPGPAAPSYEQAKPRIDPDQIPSPVQVHERDQALYSDTPYVTSLKTNVPLAATQFRAIDEGNANPRFARMTMYNIPQTEQLLRDSNLPLGMMIQPLAPLRYDETPLDVVDFGEKGPIRCGRCRAYVNPYFTFIEGGRKYVCNLCRHENEVPAEYFYNLDMTGRRLDWESRPELRCGSVEFAATREFINLEPAPLSYVFAIDVSWNAIQSGMLRECARALRNILYETEGGLHAGTRVGLVTYDKTVHFYNLAAGLEQPQMLVCPDVDHVFVPLHHGFLVDPQESREVIEALLDGLPTMFEANRTAESALGAVVQACQNALAKRGGKLMIFQASLPNYGPGALKSRDDPKLYNGDKERTLFASQDKFYPNLAEACVESGLSVNLYLFPNSYIDAATLSSLSSLTGGDTYFYPNFLADRDGHRFGEDLKLDLTREHGFNGVLRVRCSDGLRIDEHYGNFFMRNNTDVELAGIDSDKAIGVTFRHDGQLDEKNDLYFQMALLYTTAAGQRRIRVHNLAVPVTGLIGNMFRNAEMDTSVNLLAKMAVSETLAFPLRTVRDKLSDKCVRVLTAYRRHCAAGSSPGQLILPEAYKLLPLYVLAMTKTNALRPVMTSVDLRVTSMRMLKSINVQQSTSLFYPRIVPVHQLAPEHGQYDAQGHMQLPTLVRASYARLDPAGAYLFENGQIMRLWLGREVPTTFLQEALGVANQAEIDETATDLPALDTPTSQQVRAIVDHMQSLRTRYLQFRIVRQGMGQSDVDFASLLTEDKTTDGQSYVDYLCDIHRRIQIDISKSY
ncbi:COPII coat Sec23p-Sfb3p heterodimer component [Tieghemiomyces parasiticus]|uniref:COPII coat Sec23p-Sfb3p heterodimer component n=1 Tax=Tieghemiomyces parasiticus TaxID=78921 RepID=A0A9W8AGN5_9FUNG|nr:COPII coat Sec23p-Sfb3p heterodimer component [Tieghemiomyces parasiticus]